MGMYSVDPMSFVTMNPTLDCNNLVPGQIVCVSTIPVTTIITTTTAAPVICSQTYTVKSGDTCWSISNQATKIGDKFYTLNPTINCSLLYPGQVVCVDYCSLAKYTVQPGDYCWQISTQFNLTTEQFFAMNPGMECGSLKTGDVINVGKTNC